MSGAIIGAVLLLFAPVLPAQNYPVKPVRMVVGGVGGGSDFVARLIAPALATGLGQPLIVDKRGGGVYAAEIVATAPPDGYTLLFYGSNIWLAPFLREHVQYDPVKDFAPVTLAASSPSILVVHPSLPVKSVGELLALANARPGQLNYATGPAGAGNHLAAEMFRAMTGAKVVRIPYKGNAGGLNAVMGDEVQFMLPSAGAAVTPLVKSGRLRALAVTSAQPSPLFPGLPTIAASGVPGYEAASILGIFAPARSPATLIERLHREIVRALEGEGVKEKLSNIGEVAVASTPQELAAAVKSEMARYGKLIREAGIREE